MKKILTLALSLICATSIYAQSHEAEIIVNDRTKYQHVTGFGGFSPSPTWQYWLNNATMETLFGTGEDQLGLNILRLYMANSSGGWYNSVANAKVAKKHGAFIFASPWSPPGAWKSNGTDNNGGYLLESRYADWATRLNDYYKYMKQQGVEIDAVSIQNEPDWKASYQSCEWTGEQMAKFLREQGHRIECKIIAPESIHFVRGMHEPILSDPEACEHLDIMGGHFYGWDGSSYPLAAAKGKEVWMTEYLINERQEKLGLDINWKDDGFLFAKSINDAMLANMSAWVHYALKRYYGCIGDGSYGTVNDKITKRGYILSHYAKYVSGNTRVRHFIKDATASLSASAYVNDEGDRVVVMVLNPSDNEYETRFTLPFNVRGYSEVVTIEDTDMAKAQYETDETHTPEILVEPWSVNTYIFEKSSDYEAEGDEDINGTLVYSDNFDLYGASCVPEGWIARGDGSSRNPGSYSSGPRVMAFAAEGDMSHAFYFRSDTRNAGSITYGDNANMRLALEPGQYSLRFAVVGWKACPQVNVSMQKVGGRAIQKMSVTPETMVETDGTSTRIIAPTEAEMLFEITDSYNYTLRWQLPIAERGMDEALVGNIRLYRLNPTGIEDIVAESYIYGDVIYDIYGRRVSDTPGPGIYIKGGKKFIVR